MTVERRKQLSDGVNEIIERIPALKALSDASLAAKIGLGREAYNKRKNGLLFYQRNDVEKLIEYSESNEDKEALQQFIKELDGQPSSVEPEHAGVCQFCHDTFEGTDWILRPVNHICANGAGLTGEDRSNSISILHEWIESPLDPQRLPSLLSPPVDVFSHIVGENVRLQVKGQSSASAAREYLRLRLPFEDQLLKMGFHAGSPVLRNIGLMAHFHELRNDSYVLDFSQTFPSNTIEDVRAWAIVNFALEHHVQTLVLSSTGNDAYAITWLCNFVNQRKRPEDRLRIKIIDRHLSKETSELLSSLRITGAEIVSYPNRGPYDPGAAHKLIKQVDANSGRHTGTYWDVSHGWDGVGTIAYRLIMAQVISQFKPTALVLPARDGNLLVATYLAAKDCKAAVTIIATEPALRSEQNISLELESNDVLAKVRMPRSPFGQIIKKIQNNSDPDRPKIKFVPVTLADVKLAQQILKTVPLIAEPSALTPIAALLSPEIMREASSSERVLCVNSGLGILSLNEKTFLSQQF